MSRSHRSLIGRLVGIGLLSLLAACAQQKQPGYYDTPHDSTMSDALHQAQGRNVGAAPAQLQLGFGGQDQKAEKAGKQGASEAAAEKPQPAPALPPALAETRTYLGTIACPAGNGCAPLRMTLTLAPDGQWRARSQPLGNQQAAKAMLGCWYLVGTDPVRIVLQTGKQPQATLEFLQSNVLRITRLNGQAPLLESRLTRQPDIDAIQELSDHPAQPCAA